MSEEKTIDTVAVEAENSDIDFVMGGSAEADHSPEAGVDVVAEAEAAEKPVAEDKAPEKSDSAEADAKVTAELENLNKRLHDTQSAYHAETQKRAALEKELTELRKREEVSEDDWFGDEDSKKEVAADGVKEVEAKIAESDKALDAQRTEISDINQKAAEAIWDREASKVIAEHPDFEQVVYGELYSAIQPDGDAYIRDMWTKNPDKSPKGAYEFAKRMKDIQEVQKDPAAYREKVRQELRSELGLGDSAISGSDGLAMLNSDSGSAEEPSYSGDDDIDFVLRR